MFRKGIKIKHIFHSKPPVGIFIPFRPVHVSVIEYYDDNQYSKEQKTWSDKTFPGDFFLIINVKGIQYFSGTQKKSIKKLKRELKYVGELIRELSEECSFECKELEYGTGSPVCYFKEESFDEEEYFEILSQLLSSLPADIKITLEMGRSIAASCGTYYSKVVDKKSNKAGNFAIIDGGMNHLVYFGQCMAMKHPYFEMYPHRADDNAELWNICGSLCTVNDILVKSLPVTNLDTGDILIFKNTGAYCMCEGISLFLSRELPAVVIDDNGNSQLVRNHFKTSQLNKPNLNLK